MIYLTNETVSTAECIDYSVNDDNITVYFPHSVKYKE